MSLSVQFQLMIHVLLYGIFIAITLDFVYIIKEIFFNSYLQWIVIVLYWLIQVPLTFVYIYNINEGIFHLYILLFLIIGAITYFKWLKNRLHHDLEILGESLFTIVRMIKKVVNILVISPMMFIYKIVSDIIMLFLKILKLLFYTPFAKFRKRVSGKKRERRRGKKKTNLNTEKE
ncbi:MAG: spore cortex biosynthesis protein YabQ [Turicibacter sp.]|nr:spore cortex biosynthesis protein YabQ [Turicibacter sp.]